MSELAVRVENLGKQYRLGAATEWYRSLRESLVRTATAPLRGFKKSSEKSELQTIWALSNVNFEVQAGEVVGIIGRNGAGKSTLLKILSRITEPTVGRAQVYGRVGSLLEVGTGFHPELTGSENIFLNGAILGMSQAEIRRRFDEIVAFAELEDFLDTPVKRYSSGMYMRLAFSVAAHLLPDVLVVDEVLAVGDAQFQRKCLGKMQDVSREGRTVLFVSHNMPAITRLCTRAILLQAGSIVADGAAAATVGTYLQQASESQDSRRWDLETAPGTREVRLTAASVTDAAGAPVAVATVGDELTIQVEYHVATPGLKFRCCITLNTQGTCVFTSIEPFETERTHIGHYISKVKIPRHFLSEGEYTLNVSIFASRGVKQHYVSLKDVVAFQVVDPMTGDSARGDYAEGFSGVIRPKLDWNISYVENGLERAPA